MGTGSQTQGQVPLSKRSLLALREQSKRSLFAFAKGILGFDWLTPSVHLPICKHLENLEETRLKIMLPRGWYKTTLCSISYPIWRAVNNPEVRILIAQNTAKNAASKLSSVDSIFKKNHLFRALFPELIPDFGKRETRWNSESMAIKREGSYPEGTFESVGIKTQVVSRHYDEIIEDDTVAPDLDELGTESLVPTKEDIEQAIGWHRLSSPLLIDANKSRNIVVGTRWFERDLLSWIDEHEADFVRYERAARETGGKPDPLGEPAFPERFNSEALQKIEARLGPYMYSCLYMNLPLSSETLPFRREWIQYFETEPAGLVCYTSVDPSTNRHAVKSKDSDYTVVLTCGKDLRTGRVYVLEYSRARTNPGECLDMIFSHVRKYYPIKVLVESVAYQNTLEYWIKERQREQNFYFVVEGVTHGGASKEARIRGLQPAVASGVLKFRTHHTELLNELYTFPYGAHDDVIDTLSMQLKSWALTDIKPEEKVEKGVNPLSAEAAIQELRGRTEQLKKKGLLGLVASGGVGMMRGLGSLVGMSVGGGGGYSKRVA